MIFIDRKLFILGFEIKYILIDLNKIFTMRPSEFKISVSVESIDEKTAENYLNYVAEKRIVSKLSKISITNIYSTT